MPNEIFIDSNPYQVRVAVVEEGELSELYIERKGQERIAGNIYKGRVKNVLPGMQAAFVDIGLERNAFLYAGDINFDEADDFSFPEGKSNEACPDIRSLVSVGQEILVQVLKEPFGTKGARITTSITLASKSIVLMPMADYVGVSRKIDDEETRTQVKELFTEMKPDGMGIIARTIFLQMTREELEGEIKKQLDTYYNIQKCFEKAKTPSLIFSEEGLTNRTVRDLLNTETTRMRISDKRVYEQVRETTSNISPELSGKIEYFDEHYDMFEYFNIESRIEKALRRKVWLKNGGYLVFDYAEALTVVDVNTGKYVGKNDLQQTILETNIEAAKEVARQIRLRDISGIIVVDFIDMEEIENREKLMDVLREAVEKDRTRTTILGLTDLGIVEMTRKKVTQFLSSALYAPCPYCEGEGVLLSPASMAMRARKEVMRLIHESEYGHIVIKAHPAVIAEIKAMTKPGAMLIPEHEGRKVYTLAWDNMHIEHIECFGVEDERTALCNGAQVLKPSER